MISVSCSRRDLPLLDKGHLGELGVSHVAARQELREMMGLSLARRPARLKRPESTAWRSCSLTRYWGAYWMKSKGKISERQGWLPVLAFSGACGRARRPLVGAGLMAAGAAVGFSRSRGQRDGKGLQDDKTIERAQARSASVIRQVTRDLAAAHRRLIAQNHLDRGGSAAAAPDG